MVKLLEIPSIYELQTKNNCPLAMAVVKELCETESNRFWLNFSLFPGPQCAGLSFVCNAGDYHNQSKFTFKSINIFLLFANQIFTFVCGLTWEIWHDKTSRILLLSEWQALLCTSSWRNSTHNIVNCSE